MTGIRTSPTPTDLSQTSVNDLIRQYPATAAAFNRHGIDSCCGGAASVADAAARDGADAAAVIADLAKMIMESA